MRRVLALGAVTLSGCLTLDAFVFNPTPCGDVGPATCEDQDSPWDRVCLTCAEPYDWARDYDWEPGTLAAGETVRPVDAADVTPLSIPTDDGLATLDGTFLASHGGDPALATTTIVYNHGNYANLEPYQPRIRLLYQAGYNVLAWDYRGYGKSTPPEPPTPEQFLADARQIRALADTLAPDPDRIVIYGYSLGGIPAVEQSVSEPGCATLLEAPFTSMSSIGRGSSGASFGESFFSEGLFDNVRKIERYHGPLFVTVGTDDREIPIVDIEALEDAAPGAKTLWEVPGAEHGVGVGVPETAGLDDYLAKIRSFLESRAPACLGG